MRKFPPTRFDHKAKMKTEHFLATRYVSIDTMRKQTQLVNL